MLREHPNTLNERKEVSMNILSAAATSPRFNQFWRVIKQSTAWSTVLISAVLLIIIFAGTALAQYSSDLNDINTTAYGFWLKVSPANLAPTQQATSIGDLGKVEEIIDMRGFVPMSLTANSQKWTWALIDHLKWFEIPTKEALLLFYYGDLQIKDLPADNKASESKRFRGTRLTQESAAKGEDAEWCQVAYDLAKNAAPAFETLAGDGFQSAEPTTIIFTGSSVFVFLNFKYESALVKHGQVLTAMEFSRSSKRYKTLYKLYSTEVMGKSAGAAAAAFAPIAAKIVIAYFGSDSGQ